MYDYFMKNYIYQMFILGTGNLDVALENGLGGVIFFSRDIDSVSQFKTLINDIKSKSVCPPFLSIDQEGGRVERTEKIHKPYLSARYAYEKGEEFLKNQTEQIAKELKDYGINLNFAPCADVNTNPQNPIIGVRAFSDNPDDVVKGVKIVSEIYKKNGIIPCIKHYPGHGDANCDSHLTLPKFDKPLDEVAKIHIKPFKSAIDDGIDMIMVAHLHCTFFDEKEIIPASISSNALSYLRKNLGFKGVIISDDMVMGGISGYSPLDACVKGIKAGVNMFIYRESNQDTYDLIDELAIIAEKDKELSEKIIESYVRIIDLKRKFGIITLQF